MKKISIKSQSHNYDVIIDHNYAHKFNSIASKSLYPHFFFIIDSNIVKYHKEYLKSIVDTDNNENVFIFKATEKNKSIDAINHIYKELLTKHFDRHTTIVAIGGGLVGDVAAFVASTYMRGVNLLLIPTTIISCVDSSIGGKTGYNFQDFKNIIGTFYPPKLVLIDTYFLSSLPKNHIVSGLGEIIKFAFLSDSDFYNYLLSNHQSIKDLDRSTLLFTIYECLQIKKAVVQSDEKEKSLRKILNLGHTFGNSFETLSNFKLPHGIAVTLGIFFSLYLSKNLKLISKSLFNQLIVLPHLYLEESKLNTEFLDYDRFFEIVKSDKKTEKGLPRFVLLKDIGEVILDINIPEDVLKKAFLEAKTELDSVLK